MHSFFITDRLQEKHAFTCFFSASMALSVEMTGKSIWGDGIFVPRTRVALSSGVIGMKVLGGQCIR